MYVYVHEHLYGIKGNHIQMFIEISNKDDIGHAFGQHSCRWCNCSKTLHDCWFRGIYDLIDQGHLNTHWHVKFFKEYTFRLHRSGLGATQPSHWYGAERINSFYSRSLIKFYFRRYCQHTYCGWINELITDLSPIYGSRIARDSLIHFCPIRTSSLGRT